MALEPFIFLTFPLAGSQKNDHCRLLRAELRKTTGQDYRGLTE